MVLRNLRALRELGLFSLIRYGIYRLALRSGYFRLRLPVRSWLEVDFSGRLKKSVPSDHHGYAVFRRQVPSPAVLQFGDTSLPGIQHTREAIERDAEAVLAGRFRLFGSPVNLGFPPDWHSFAPMGETVEIVRYPTTDHWSTCDEAALPQDVKLLWEASRFAWIYPLAQAFHLNGDVRYFEGFWTLYRSWLEANPPQMGLHWFSAQEVAFRLIALLSAAQAFSEPMAANPERWADLVKGIAVHAERIPPTMPYARAQNNNHLLLESAALYLAGTYFPEMRGAAAWKRDGRREFERGIIGQVFADGGYVQHSSNYQRLALQAGLLVALAGQRIGEPLSPPVMQALGRMTHLLNTLTDGETGRTPNFGPNDGATLLPLNASAYEDFRPTLQAAWRLLWGAPCYPGGTWDDLSSWLGLDDESAGALSSKRDGALSPELPDLSTRYFPQAGLQFMQNEKLKTILRAAEFHQRPGHSDQLHLDIWRQGVNLAHDPGSYHYNAAPPWQNPFTGAWCHNTVMLRNCEPMFSAGRFLWLDWSRAEAQGRWTSGDGRIEVLCAQHHSRRWGGIWHQRTVAVIGGDLILVADDLLGSGDHARSLNWNLADLPWKAGDSELSLQQGDLSASIAWEATDSSWGLYRAGNLVAGEEAVKDPTTYGWHAPRYAQKLPALQFVLNAHGALPDRLVTNWVFQGARRDALEVGWTPVGDKGPAFHSLVWGASEWAI